jgi:predicted DNA-binding transcriptional regulator AlpA
MKRLLSEYTGGKSRAWLYVQLQKGTFPAPVHVGRTPMWYADEVAAWQASLGSRR